MAKWKYIVIEKATRKVRKVTNSRKAARREKTKLVNGRRVPNPEVTVGRVRSREYFERIGKGR